MSPFPCLSFFSFWFWFSVFFFFINSFDPCNCLSLFFSTNYCFLTRVWSPTSIVIITSLVVAGTASAISNKFGTFSQIGGIIGTSVSAVFLILLGLVNAYLLYKLCQQLQKLIAANDRGEHHEFEIKGAGCLFHVFKKLFKLIDRPWKMYPLGIMFGLGFDTSSEVALLGIASIQGAKGTSIWLILIFPVLFTAGMCLLDTVDGALMMALYTSTNLAKDQIAILYYSIVLTVLTVLVAVVIGCIQLLTLILNIAQPVGEFWVRFPPLCSIYVRCA